MRLHLSFDRPEDGGHFPDNCNRDDDLAFANGHKLAVATVEPACAFQAISAHSFRQCGLSFLQQPAYASREPVGPSALDEYASNAAIAGFRNAAASDPLSGRVFERAHVTNSGGESDAEHAVNYRLSRDAWHQSANARRSSEHMRITPITR